MFYSYLKAQGQKGHPPTWNVEEKLVVKGAENKNTGRRNHMEPVELK